MTRKLIIGLLLALSFQVHSYGEDYGEMKSRIAAKYQGSAPKKWGEDIQGVLTKLDTKENKIALTFDACGSKGDGFDSSLFGYLVENKIPATFFISGRWIDRHPEEFKKIASNPLFEIENHGLEHKPASVNGRSVYGIEGTRSAAALVDEVELNARKIEELTGRKPIFYRSGTAYYDEAAVKIIGELGYRIAGFSVLGDMGATYTRAQVEKALSSAPAGSIIIFHINHPEKGTGKGVIAAIPKLRTKGIKFTKLESMDLK